MPSLGSYTEATNSDLLKAIFLWPYQSNCFLKPEKVHADMTNERFSVGISPTSPEVAEVQQEWNNPGAYTVPSNFSIQALERQYVFRDRGEVIGFLESHAFLVSLLLEAYSKIRSYFPEYPQVILEVVTDPEVPDDNQLVASIKTNLSPNEALEKLDSFDSEWWLRSMDRARGELCISVEFL